MTNWQKHTGTERPAELAGAQIVEVEWPFRATPGRYTHIAGNLNWTTDTFYYRPVFDPDGIPYCGAEGLEPWAEYLAIQYHGGAFQYEKKPSYSEKHGGWTDWSFIGGDDPLIEPAPPEFAKPGDPADSLMRVWRE